MATTVEEGDSLVLNAYPARYHDALGEEQTIIENDGKQLRMVVRGVEFVGRTSMHWYRRLTRLIRT